MDCGVSPRCAHTGMPRWLRRAVVSASQAPPSSFTICAPSRISTAAFSKLCDSV